VKLFAEHTRNEPVVRFDSRISVNGAPSQVWISICPPSSNHRSHLRLWSVKSTLRI